MLPHPAQHLTSNQEGTCKRDLISTQRNKCRLRGKMAWETWPYVSNITRRQAEQQQSSISLSMNAHCAMLLCQYAVNMQAALLSLSLSLLPCKHCLFLIFQFVGLHDNKIIPCRKHWSGSEGNTKGSAHKASQCSQCTLLRRQTTSSSQQL